MNQAGLSRLREYMQQQGQHRLLLAQPENFAWITGGDNTVPINRGAATLEVGLDYLRIHASNIEARRLSEEEVAHLEVVSFPWYAPSPPSGPSDSEHDLTHLRVQLSPEEHLTYRQLGLDTSAAVGEVMRAALPSWTEQQLAGALAEALYSRGVRPLVLMAAGQERIQTRRHPIPKALPLGRLALAAVCARRRGLVASVSRVKSWGFPTAQELNQQLLQVEAAALDSARPGQTLGQVLQQMQAAYQGIGQPDQWQLHHQGGLTGYRPREILAMPHSQVTLQTGMAVAFNPSQPGAKVEDTFLITPTGLENLTPDPLWPSLDWSGRSRPLVLAE